MTRLIQTNHPPFPSPEKIPRKRREVQARSEQEDEDTYLSIQKEVDRPGEIDPAGQPSRSSDTTSAPGFACSNLIAHPIGWEKPVLGTEVVAHQADVAGQR